MDNYLDGLRSMRLYRQANLLPTTSSSQHFTLENIASYTMELDIGDHRGFSTFTLRGVPLFLVDAFNILRISGLDASGIFRKEGNIGRLKTFSMQTFFGGKKLPEDCTTHDFGDRHEAHRMTVENIARVFAPSLFRDNPPPAPSKRKRGSQDDLIISVRNENELRIAIIIDLIDNAHKIGVPRDYYLASRRPSDATQKKYIVGIGSKA
ncbi:unnamed protein product [Gongylonema pulchrum]|uniref:Pkinase_fungal domain-containing protein n=1 Tax=Gongylonema pulchrum TaxID=637853 RepID=A0A183DXD2_9BILA|nr:unnamed protein product [Gongylonema pulchrum]